MRVISGIYKGRKLTPPDDDKIRPTSDRTRESIFNLIMHGQFGGQQVMGQRVADICCGTGALGIEALSRGASHCTFVDQTKAHLALAEKNCAAIGATNAHFITCDATRLPNVAEPFALILIDPPYENNIIPRVATSLREKGWVKSGSIMVTEVIFSNELPPLEGYEMVSERKYGKAKILIWRVL
jgi:16S rRNA (guanine966-N2)-methyltransferase